MARHGYNLPASWGYIMWAMLWYRAVRVLYSLSVAVLVASGAVIGGLVVAAATAVPVPTMAALPSWVISALIGALVLLIAHVIAEYKRRTYDPTYIFTFDKRFDDIKKARARAASILKERRATLGQHAREFADIDEVLDFFDDLGFFVRGHQISPEIAHQFFYVWIQGYYEIAGPYIRAAQNKNPPQWEYIKKLYDLTFAVEKRRFKNGRVLTLIEETIIEFLDDEINLVQVTE